MNVRWISTILFLKALVTQLMYADRKLEERKAASAVSPIDGDGRFILMETF